MVADHWIGHKPFWILCLFLIILGIWKSFEIVFWVFINVKVTI